MIRVGLIGFGLSGRVFHLPFLMAHGGFEVVAVASSKEAEVRAVLPSARVYKDARQLIADPDVDLVINCAPNSEHFNLSALALRNGKHVVVEKPFVNTVKEGRELIEIAQRAEKVLSVFQNRRWDADFLTVAKLLREGQLGRIQQFESHFDRWRPDIRPERWREQAGSGSGVLFDLGAHLIDQALVLFGKPDSIEADVERQRPGAQADDYFRLTLKYGDMRAILHSTSLAKEPTPRFQIRGNRASYIKTGLDPQEQQLKDGLSPRDETFGIDSNDGVITTANGTLAIKSEIGCYSEYYDRLHSCLTKEGENPVPASQALEVIEIIESILTRS